MTDTNIQAKVLGSFKAQANHSDVTGVRKDDVFKIPPQSLQEEPGFNERDYTDPKVVEKIEDFADAYTNSRFVPPLIVRIDRATGILYVVEGHQRRRGALLAIERGAVIPHLLCIPFRGNDRDRVFCQLSSQEGLKLKPVGIARNYLKLLNMGATEQEIAKTINMTLTHVQGMLVLAEAPSAVQKMVNDETVSATLAIDIVRQYGDKAVEHLQAKLTEAKAQGRKKIKPASMRDWVPPRKSSIAIYASLGTLAETVKKQADIAELMSKCAEQPDAAAGTSVQVDAGVLIQLLQAFEDAEALKAKRAPNKAMPSDGAAASTEDDTSEA